MRRNLAPAPLGTALRASAFLAGNYCRSFQAALPCVKPEKTVTLEMLSSFSLGEITPYTPDDAPNRLFVHRYRSTWSAEGRLDT